MHKSLLALGTVTVFSLGTLPTQALASPQPPKALAQTAVVADLKPLLGRPGGTYAKLLGKPVSQRSNSKEGTVYTYHKAGFIFKVSRDAVEVTAPENVDLNLSEMLQSLGFSGRYGQLQSFGNFQDENARGEVFKVTKVQGKPKTLKGVQMYKGKYNKTQAPFMQLILSF